MWWLVFVDNPPDNNGRESTRARAIVVAATQGAGRGARRRQSIGLRLTPARPLHRPAAR